MYLLWIWMMIILEDDNIWDYMFYYIINFYLFMWRLIYWEWLWENNVIKKGNNDLNLYWLFDIFNLWFKFLDIII